MPERLQETQRLTVITTPTGPLHGTLRTPPAPPVAAALLLPGSGPVDRDSDHRKLPLGVTRLLAEGLADAGVLTLRYDERVGESTGDFWSTGMLQYVEDAVEALRVLRAAAASAPVFPVGHSEGALLTTAVAAREPVDGLVLLSGAARSGRETLAWQAEALQSDLPAVVRLVLTLLRTDLPRMNRRRIDKVVRTSADRGRVGGARTNLRWLREFVTFDPREHLPQVRVPLAAITARRTCRRRRRTSRRSGSTPAARSPATSSTTSTTSCARSRARRRSAATAGRWRSRSMHASSGTWSTSSSPQPPPSRVSRSRGLP